MRSIFSLLAAQQACASRAALRARFAVREASSASARAASASLAAPAAISWAAEAAPIRLSTSARSASISLEPTHPAPNVITATTLVAAVHLAILLFTQGTPFGTEGVTGAGRPASFGR